MAKAKAKSEFTADQLPGAESGAPALQTATESPSVKPASKAPEPPPTPEIKQTELTIVVPFIDGMDGYRRRRVDINLTSKQAERLKGILQGLEAAGEAMDNGRFVSTQSHAIQWMIEKATA